MIGKITKFDAVNSLVGGGISKKADGIIYYHSGQTPPTEEEIDAEVKRLQDEYDAQEYARNREAEYPSIQDVTVALAEKAEGSSTMWDDITAQREAVKSKYPKP